MAEKYQEKVPEEIKPGERIRVVHAVTEIRITEDAVVYTLDNGQLHQVTRSETVESLGQAKVDPPASGGVIPPVVN